MLTRHGPKVLEFNCRFGDPETQAILPRWDGDLLPALEACARGGLTEDLVRWKDEACACVVMAAGGYPGRYFSGERINGLEEASRLPGVTVFHAGTQHDGNDVVTAGGRVLGVTALGEDLERAVERAYGAVNRIHFRNAHYRKDIAWRAMRRLAQAPAQLTPGIDHMNIRRFAALMLFVLLPLAARGQPATNAPAPVEADLAASVADVLKIVGKHHLPLDQAAACRAAAEGILRSIDPSARVLNARDSQHVEEERKGQDYQIGVRLGMSNGWPRIVAVASNSPAARAGVAVGSTLAAVNGESLQDRNLPDAIASLRGHSNETIRLTMTDGTTTNDVEVKSELLTVPGIEISEDFPFGLGYAKVNGLFPETGRELAALIRGWAEMDRAGVIVDLRGADGRDLDSVVHVGNLLAETGALLFTFRDNQQDLAVYKAGESDPVPMPVMALVDHDTRGAAEVLAAVLAHSVHGAMLIGSPTFGDPEVREVLELAGGDRAYVATRRLVTAQGATFEGREGVKPTITVTGVLPQAVAFEPETGVDRRATLDEELADNALRDRVGRDAALRRAVDLLLGLKALNIGRDGVSLPAKAQPAP